MKHQIVNVAFKKTGRPRAFNEADALNNAMLSFWRYGYESTSMAILSKKMGMSPPSIYSTFGDKKALFLAALDLYVGDLKVLEESINGAESAYVGAHEMLKASAIRFTSIENPRGCMLASSIASCSAESVDVQIYAARKRASIEEILKARIEKDIELKLLPKQTSASGLAAFTMVVIQGLSVFARDGVSRNKLLLISDHAMLSWPVL